MARPESYGTLEQVLEVYAGVWGAAADASGADYWVNQIETNINTIFEAAQADNPDITYEEVYAANIGPQLGQVAASFFDQPRVAPLYQDADGQYLLGDDLRDALYENIFKIDPATVAENDLNYWTGVMEELGITIQENGTYSDNIGTLVMMMIDGMWVNDDAAATQTLYQNWITASVDYYGWQNENGIDYNSMTPDEQANFLAGAATLTGSITATSTPEEIDTAVDQAKANSSPSVPLYSLEDFLALETPPESYRLNAAIEFDAGAVSIADAGTQYAAAEAAVNGATNSANLSMDKLFAWSIEDTAANITANLEAATVTGADTVSLSDAATVEQATAITGLSNFDGTYNLADTAENILAADAALVGGAGAFALTDPVGTNFTVTAEQREFLEQATNADQYTFGTEGSTIDLTPAVDIVGPSVEGDMRTTVNNDSINGKVSSLSSERTLNSEDQIDGGEGFDTLNAAMLGNFAGFSGDGKLVNVETVNLTNTGTVARSFAAKGVEGVDIYNLTGLVNLSDLSSTETTVNLSNIASGAVTIAYATGAITAGADTQALGLNNIGTVKSGSVNEAAVTVTAGGVKALNINAQGDNVIALGADDAAAIEVTGGSTLKLTDVGTGLKTYDGSAMKGAQDVQLSAASSVTQFVGGEGDDIIRVNPGDLTNNAQINGGAGTDTLYLYDAVGTVQYMMSDVETVKIKGVDGTFSATDTSGLQTVEIHAGNAANKASFANLGTMDLGVDLTGGAASQASFDHTGSTTVSVTGGTKDSVNNTTAQVTLTGSTSVDIQSEAFNNLSGTIAASKAQTLTSTNGGHVTLGAGSNFTKVQTLTINSNAAFDADTNDVNFAALASAALTGVGNTAKVMLNDLGSTTNDYGLSVTAEGLAGGTTIGKITTGNSQDVSVEASNALGNVSIGAINASGGTGDVTLTFNGTQGNIQVNAADSTGNTSAITAETVTIDASGALGTVDIAAYLGDPTAAPGTDQNIRSHAINADTVSFTGSALQANGVGATVSKAATMVGGIEDDIFVMSADPTAGQTAAISLTGGLGNDIFAFASGAAAPAGSVKVTITDFNAGDVTNDSIAELRNNITDTWAATYLNSVDGISGADAANVTIVDGTLGDAILYGSNTYFVIGTGNAFGDGETLLQLTGAQLDTAAQVNAFFSYNNDPTPPLPFTESGPFTITEPLADGGAVGTVAATGATAYTITTNGVDVDGDGVLPYAIANTGALTIADAGDLANGNDNDGRAIVVEASAAGATSNSADVTINIDPAPALPFTESGPFTITEPLADGGAVGTVAATGATAYTITTNGVDVDGDGVLPYAIADTGALTIADAGDLANGNDNDGRAIVVEASAVGATSNSADVTINIDPAGSLTPIDVDNQGNYVTSTSVDVGDLGADAFDLQDDATVRNYVTATNYGADDVITYTNVTEADFAAQALFSTIDAAGTVRIIYTDPVGLDASVIELVGVAGANVISSYQGFQDLAAGDIQFA